MKKIHLRNISWATGFAKRILFLNGTQAGISFLPGHTTILHLPVSLEVSSDHVITFEQWKMKGNDKCQFQTSPYKSPVCHSLLLPFPGDWDVDTLGLLEICMLMIMFTLAQVHGLSQGGDLP